MTDNAHRDYDLHDHLARGRQLRSAAFLNAFALVARGVKRLIASAKLAKAPQNA